MLSAPPGSMGRVSTTSDRRPGPPPRARGAFSVRDVVLTLAAIGVVVAGVYLVLPQPDSPVIQPVDLDGALEVAVAADDVPVLLPDLGEGWEVTSARRERPDQEQPASWHLGYLTPSQEYAGLEVAEGATGAWLRRVTSDGTEASTQDVDGVAWQVVESVDPARTSLVLDEAGRTVVVTGSAPLDELVELARAASAPDAVVTRPTP
jgi:hypothetical protein